MHPLRKQRLYIVLFIVIGASVAAGLVFWALRDNMNFFYAPAQVAAGETRGTAFGWYNMVAGLTAIPAGLTFGLIWQAAGAAGAFAAAAAIALVASALLGRWLAAR